MPPKMKAHKAKIDLVLAILAGILITGLLLFGATKHPFTLAHHELWKSITHLADLKVHTTYNKPMLWVLQGFASLFGWYDANASGFYALSNALSSIYAVVGFVILGLVHRKQQWFILLPLLALCYPFIVLLGFHYQLSSLWMFFALCYYTSYRLARVTSAKNAIWWSISVGLLLSSHHAAWVFSLPLIAITIWHLQSRALVKKHAIRLIAPGLVVALGSLPEVFYGFPQSFTTFFATFHFNGKAYSGTDVPFMAKLQWMWQMAPLIGIALFAILALFNAFKQGLSFHKKELLWLLPLFCLPLIPLQLKGDLALWTFLPVILFLLAIRSLAFFSHSMGIALMVIVGVLQVLLPRSLPLYASSTLKENTNSKVLLIKQEGDYLQHQAYSFLLKSLKSSPSEQWATNLATPVPFSVDQGGSLRHVRYNQRQWARYSQIMVSRDALIADQKTNPAFGKDPLIERENQENLLMHYSMSRDTVGELGRSLLQQERYGEAIVAFKRSGEANPYHEGLALLLARAQFQLALWDDALINLESALASDPYFPEALCLKAEILLKQNRQDDALAALQHCWYFHPRFGKAYWVLGNHHLHNGKLDKATEYLQLCSSLPGSMKSTAQKQLALIEELGQSLANEAYFAQKIQPLLNNQNPKAALLGYQAQLQQWQELDTANAQIHHAQGMILMYLQRFTQAIEHFSNALACNPNLLQTREFLSQAYVNQGAIYFEQDSFAQAIYHFNYALDYNPDDEQAMQNAAITLTEMAKLALDNNQDEALAYLNQAIVKWNYAPAHMLMGQIAQETGDETGAKIAFTRAHKIDDQWAPPLRELIDIYQKENDQTLVNIYQKRLKHAREEY